MFSNLVFDLDGTLIDSTDTILEAFQAGFDELHPVYPGDEKIRQNFGKKLEAIFGYPLSSYKEL